MIMICKQCERIISKEEKHKGFCECGNTWDVPSAHVNRAKKLRKN